MLNKLLKRCMPWMDKGRWYKLELVGTEDSYIVNHDKSDPVFSTATVSYNQSDSILEIDNSQIMFLDVKCIMETAFRSVITLSYFSNIFNTMINTSEFADLAPYEGKKLKLYIFGR